MADRRLRDLTEKATAQDDDVVWQDRDGQAEARKLSVQAINARAPQGDMQAATYDPAAKSGQVALESELYTDGQADARIAASNVEAHANVAAGATEGEVLVSRAGTWTPEPPSGGGSGDMEKATYDPAGKNRQLAAEDELYTDGQADARIAAANAGDLADVGAGGVEGQILIRRTGTWTPEDFPGGGGGGDMLASVYDPAGKTRQLAAEDELYTDGQADARIAAAAVEDLDNVTGAPNEGDVLVSRTGVWTPEAPASGVTDHGDLAGLGDDDHTQYHTELRADTWLTGKSTTDLAEGTNLYYTDARVDTWLTGKSTTDLAEGANLYYTDARVDTRVNAADLVPRVNAAGVTRAVQTYASASGTVNLDVAAAQVHDVQMTGATTLAFTGWPAAGEHAEILVQLTGSQTVTLPAAVLWDSATAPTLTGGRDVLAFWTVDGGTSVVGVAIALGAA